MVNNNQKIILYATAWCYQSRNIRAFLDQNKIPYDYVDIDKDKAGEEFVLITNHGYRSVPTLLFPDGSTLTEPSQKALLDKIGLT
jgi:glutaredoxin